MTHEKLTPQNLVELFRCARAGTRQAYQKNDPAGEIAEIAGRSTALLDLMEAERAALKADIEYLDEQIEKIKPIADYFRKSKEYERNNN